MPILDSNSLELFSNSADQSRRIGIQLGSLLQPGNILCLQGELGTGKTTFAQGLAAGWGSADQVSSPTYVLMNIYARADGRKMTHMDAYRIENLQEAEELDFMNHLDQGPLVIEWAEKIEPLLPDERIWVRLFHVAEERRRIEISPEGEHYMKLLSNLQEAVFGVA
jgi:tRNA threonylcarbamoyladenosine biosynthesis protein TsaE